METSVSLLERLCTQPDEAAWRRLDELYRPLIRRWLLREPALRDEAEDVTQEVMSVLVRELPNFRRERVGSFRCWLRTITFHRVQACHRTRLHRPRAAGGPAEECPLNQLADPESDLSRQWDDEHNRHIVRRLLELIRDDFTPNTLRAFHRAVFDEAPAAAVADELGITVNAVLVAKSKVLRRLRQEIGDLLT